MEAQLRKVIDSALVELGSAEAKENKTVVDQEHITNIKGQVEVCLAYFGQSLDKVTSEGTTSYKAVQAERFKPDSEDNAQLAAAKLLDNQKVLLALVAELPFKPVDNIAMLTCKGVLAEKTEELRTMLDVEQIKEMQSTLGDMQNQLKQLGKALGKAVSDWQANLKQQASMAKKLHAAEQKAAEDIL